MNNKLYVGNLAKEVTETELKELFAPSGTVTSVSIATDRETAQPRGFAFVEMSTDAEAQAAIATLDGKNVGGKPITVNISTPKPKAGASR